MVDQVKGPASGVRELLDKAQDALRVSRVFGEPYEKDGAMIIPVASVRGGGGGGGGGGTDDSGSAGEGEGAGFGIAARPVGVYVVKGGEADWQPAVDVNKIVAMSTFVLSFFILAVWRVQKVRAKRTG